MPTDTAAAVGVGCRVRRLGSWVGSVSAPGHGMESRSYMAGYEMKHKTGARKVGPPRQHDSEQQRQQQRWRGETPSSSEDKSAACVSIGTRSSKSCRSCSRDETQQSSSGSSSGSSDAVIVSDQNSRRGVRSRLRAFTRSASDIRTSPRLGLERSRSSVGYAAGATIATQAIDTAARIPPFAETVRCNTDPGAIAAFAAKARAQVPSPPFPALMRWNTDPCAIAASTRGLCDMDDETAGAMLEALVASPSLDPLGASMSDRTGDVKGVAGRWGQCRQGAGSDAVGPKAEDEGAAIAAAIAAALAYNPAGCERLDGIAEGGGYDSEDSDCSSDYSDHGLESCHSNDIDCVSEDDCREVVHQEVLDQEAALDPSPPPNKSLVFTCSFNEYPLKDQNNALPLALTSSPSPVDSEPLAANDWAEKDVPSILAAVSAAGAAASAIDQQRREPSDLTTHYNRIRDDLDHAHSNNQEVAGVGGESLGPADNTVRGVRPQRHVESLADGGTGSVGATATGASSENHLAATTLARQFPGTNPYYVPSSDVEPDRITRGKTEKQGTVDAGEETKVCGMGELDGANGDDSGERCSVSGKTLAAVGVEVKAAAIGETPANTSVDMDARDGLVGAKSEVVVFASSTNDDEPTAVRGGGTSCGIYEPEVLSCVAPDGAILMRVGAKSLANPEGGGGGTAAIPYHLLAGVGRELPRGVNPANREEWLSAEEFAAVMGMSYGTFKRLPLWRRRILKEKVGLF